MSRLLSYYQKELSFLRKHGKRFAEKYPNLARRLGYQDGESEDPHVERLVESFAFLSARIHQRLDEDLPEVMEALLKNLVPQFLYPYPSACIIATEPDPVTSGLTSPAQVPVGTYLHARYNRESFCTFRTVYPLTILPVTVRYAGLDYCKNSSIWELNIILSLWSGASMDTDKIRFYINAPDNIAGTIYTLLLSEVEYAELDIDNDIFQLSQSDISCVGFEPSETMLPEGGYASYIHKFMLDYFSFPDKFYFFDVKLPGNNRKIATQHIKLKIKFNLSYMTYNIDRMKHNVNADIFKINCTPVINLFERRSEPVQITPSCAEYKVIGDIRYPNEVKVWSVVNVILHRRKGDDTETIFIPPLSGLEHSVSSDIYWSSIKRLAVDDAPPQEEIFISLSHKDKRFCDLDCDGIITMELLCTNGNIPLCIEPEDFHSELPVADLRIMMLHRPTETIPPVSLSKINWRIISQLSLNHVMLSSDNGAALLRETLEIYNYNQNPVNSRFISWIHDIQVTPVTSRLSNEKPGSVARGIEILIIMDNDAYTDPDYYLFCCCLERFLGHFAPVNSFTKVITQIENKKHTRKCWPVRAGRLSWL